MTSIIGYLDLLKRGQYNNNTQLQEYLETTYSKSQRLKYLIDELFEYTRLSGIDAKLNLNEVDLSGLLEQIVGEYIPIFEKESLIVQKSITQEIIPIFIDAEKMVRVYENLFMNAIKYSMKPSQLFICLELMDNKAILKVSNKVERSPVSDPNKLFERFFRGDKARKIIKEMDWDLLSQKELLNFMMVIYMQNIKMAGCPLLLNIQSNRTLMELQVP